MLSPKQMLQRLAIALAQVRAANRLNLRRGERSVALSTFIIYYTWENISSYNNNKFKISAPTWSNEFELAGGSYSVSH